MLRRNMEVGPIRLAPKCDFSLHISWVPENPVAYLIL